MSEEQENIVRTTVRMPVSLHKALTDEIQRRKYTPRKTSIDRAVQEAVTNWLHGSSTSGIDVIESSALRQLPEAVQLQLSDVVAILREGTATDEGRALKTQIEVAVNEYRRRVRESEGAKHSGRRTGTR